MTQAMKQRMEEFTVTVHRMTLSSVASLQMELVKCLGHSVCGPCWGTKVSTAFKSAVISVCSAGSNPQYCQGTSFSEVPNGQWMSQCFADQIPEFSAGVTRQEEGSSM